MKPVAASSTGPGPAVTGPLVRAGGPLVFLSVFAVYISTIAPGVTFWDSGELILGAASLGNPHPPGYPVFCILGKAASLIPFGSVAYRVNSMSAFFGAATAWLLYRLVREMGGAGAGPSLVAGALSLGFSLLPSCWGVSAVAEVYTINVFLLTATAYLLFRYSDGGGQACLHASSFTAGLALVNHQSVVFLLPAFTAFFLLSDGNYRKPALVIQSAAFFMFGYSAVLYLPVRAAAGPAINIGDPDTLGKFVWMLKWDEGVSAAKGAAVNLLHLPAGTGLLLLSLAALACIAAVFLIFGRHRFPAFLAAASLTFFAGITALSHGAVAVRKWGLHEKFYIPAFLFMAPLAAWAVLRVTTPAGGRQAGPGRAAVFAGLLLMAVPAVLLARGYKGADNSRNWFAHDFASDMLKSVRQDAALFGWGDNGVFPVWYLQGVERYRDDVFYMHSELLTYNWYMDGVRARMREKYGAVYKPEHRLTLLDKNVPGLWDALGKETPTYLDFSAVYQLKVPWEDVRPQGMVYKKPGPDDVPQSVIWDGVTARSARDTEANRKFAVEGVLDIYGFQSYRWGTEACYGGLVQDSERAFALCEVFAPGMFTSRCAGKGNVVDLRKDKGR